MRKGKMSSIRRRSNKNYNLYDKFGNLKLENLNKKDRKKYLKKQEASPLLLTNFPTVFCLFEKIKDPKKAAN